MNYNKIYKVTMVSRDSNFKLNKYVNQYILTCDNCDADMEINLTGNLCFNTDYMVTKRVPVTEVHDINDILSFIDRNKINISDDSIDVDNNIFWVGGECDYGLSFENLERLGWKEDLKLGIDF